MSQDDKVSVKIEADPSALRTGMQAGAQDVAANTAAMQSSFDKLKASVTGNMAAVKEAVQGNISGVTGALTGLQGAFVAVSAALAGAAAIGGLKEMVMRAAEGAAKLHDLAMVSGMTVESLSALSAAGKTSGTSIETIVSASNKLTKTLASSTEESAGAAQAIKALGMNYQQFIGLSPEARMKAIADSMAGFKDGADKTAAAIALLGRNGAELLPYFDDLAKVGSLQARVSAEQAAQADSFTDNLIKLKSSSESWKKELSMGMIPALNEMSKVMLDMTNRTGGFRDVVKKLAADGSITEWTRNAISALSYMADAVQYIGRIFVTVGDTIGYVVASNITILEGLGNASQKALKGDFGGAANDLKSTLNKTIGMMANARDSMADIWAADTVGSKFRAAMEKVKGASELDTTSKKTLNFSGAAPATGGKDGRMEKWEEALAAKRDALQREAALDGNFRELSKSEEAAYWKAILDTLSATDEKRTAVARKYYAASAGMRKDAFDAEMQSLNTQKDEAQKNFGLRILLAEEAYDRVAKAYGSESKEAKKAYADMLKERRSLDEQVRKIEENHGETRRKIAQDDLDAEKQAALGMASIANATALEKLAIERQFVEQKHALDVADMQWRLSLQDPEKDPEAYQRLKDKLLEIEAKYRQDKRALDTKEQQENPIVGIINEAQNKLGTLGETLLTNWRNIGAQLKGIMMQIGASIINELVTKPLAAEIAGWARRMAMKLGFLTQEKALNAAGSASTVGMKIAEAQTVVAADAVEAGAGAASSQASIPYVGPILAIAAMAAIMSQVGGLAGSIPSARGGFAVPSGVNPMTQLHEEEMVLPREDAKTMQALRGVVDGQSSSGVSIRAVPMGEFLAVHSHDFAKLMRNMERSNLWRPGAR